MMGFVSGLTLGLATGVAFENRSQARRLSAATLNATIALLEVARGLVLHQEKEIRELLDQVNGAAKKIRAVHRARAAT